MYIAIPLQYLLFVLPLILPSISSQDCSAICYSLTDFGYFGECMTILEVCVLSFEPLIINDSGIWKDSALRIPVDLRVAGDKLMKIVEGPKTGEKIQAKGPN